MFFGAIVFLALSLAQNTNAQIPIPCANFDALTERKCCPIPTVVGETDPGPCGVNIGRGSCQELSVANSTITDDVRFNWPIGYFNRTCVCSDRFGGYDCGECDFAYIGNDCSREVTRNRTSITTLTDEEWTEYRNALSTARNTPSRYMVVTTTLTGNVQDLIDSMVNPTIYEMFVWMHHYAAKDNELDDPVDFAHDATGFPTWHRLYLLWLEREIQQEIGNPLFSLHYWDWRDPDQRRALFTEDRLGENNNGVVEGELFQDWNTSCWTEVTNTTSLVPICDPTVSTGALRRCPVESACDSNTNWPTYSDANSAVAIEAYDASPYDKYVLEGTSFRNYMEGYVVQTGTSCGDDTLCTEENGYTIRRKLHNTVHIILGIGHFQTNLTFNMTGVMGDVKASPNDPIFINHHTMVDCILEAWLQQNKGSSYPESDKIHAGHRANDYIVPFMPLYTNNQMFKTADNFGYACTLDNIERDSSATVSVYSYTVLLGTLFAVSIIGTF